MNGEAGEYLQSNEAEDLPKAYTEELSEWRLE